MARKADYGDVVAPGATEPVGLVDDGIGRFEIEVGTGERATALAELAASGRGVAPGQDPNPRQQKTALRRLGEGATDYGVVSATGHGKVFQVTPQIGACLMRREPSRCLGGSLKLGDNALHQECSFFRLSYR